MHRPVSVILVAAWLATMNPATVWGQGFAGFQAAPSLAPPHMRGPADARAANAVPASTHTTSLHADLPKSQMSDPYMAAPQMTVPHMSTPQMPAPQSRTPRLPTPHSITRRLDVPRLIVQPLPVEPLHAPPQNVSPLTPPRLIVSPLIAPKLNVPLLSIPPLVNRPLANPTLNNAFLHNPPLHNPPLEVPPLDMSQEGPPRGIPPELEPGIATPNELPRVGSRQRSRTNAMDIFLRLPPAESRSALSQRDRQG